MIHYAGGDGLTLETAIKIIGAKNENEGLDAEHDLIIRRFDIVKNDYKILLLELYEIGHRSYHRISMIDEDGKQSDMWFDVTNF